MLKVDHEFYMNETQELCVKKSEHGAGASRMQRRARLPRHHILGYEFQKARERLNAEQQHGPVRVIVKDGKPITDPE